jgi:isocitrate dehydrogenase kinase/phosphatase
LHDPDDIARQILAGFRDYRERFSDITRAAPARFVAADWDGIQAASRQRILLYKQTKRAISDSIDAKSLALNSWIEIRSSYEKVLHDVADAELAATFFNSLYRDRSQERPLDDRHAFVTVVPVGGAGSGLPLATSFTGRQIKDVFDDALRASTLIDHYRDLDTDLQKIEQQLLQSIPLLREDRALELEIISKPFFRNKGAYLFGRLMIDAHVFPLAIALCNDRERGVYVDAVLWGESRLSVIFSFTRSYFMVDLASPGQLVDYLQRLLPVKKRWELYTSLGYYKQGKTEFVRGYRHHMDISHDRFVIAEGIKGQVMMVFSLASYQTVFKVMKDRFPATKNVDHKGVRATYQLVKTHDRVGRMADTQEFQYFEFPRTRFDPALLEELLDVASNSVEVRGDSVIIRHLYTERLMTPLNLYLQRCSDFQATQVIEDYGYAIKELAAANIFPGDMLLKNFGVTRHGRVVFYDYDEICYLTQVHFREIPEVEGDGIQSSEPWFDVGEYDVFPEEFSNFLFPDENKHAAFTRLHGDLFTAEGWRVIQAQVLEQQLMDVYPYPARERLGTL